MLGHDVDTLASMDILRIQKYVSRACHPGLSTLIYSLRRSALDDSRVVPFSGIVLSVVALLLRTAHNTCLSRTSKGVLPGTTACGTPANTSSSGEGHAFGSVVHRSGGSTVLVLELVRLLSCVALLGLSISTVATAFGDVAAWWSRFVQVETYVRVALSVLE